MAFDEEERAAVSFILDSAIRLGATLGTWLDTDQHYANQAAHSALDAMKPHFISELESSFQQIQRDKEGCCKLCGKKTEAKDA